MATDSANRSPYYTLNLIANFSWFHSIRFDSIRFDWIQSDLIWVDFNVGLVLIDFCWISLSVFPCCCIISSWCKLKSAYSLRTLRAGEMPNLRAELCCASISSWCCFLLHTKLSQKQQKRQRMETKMNEQTSVFILQQRRTHLCCWWCCCIDGSTISSSEQQVAGRGRQPLSSFLHLSSPSEPTFKLRALNAFRIVAASTDCLYFPFCLSRRHRFFCLSLASSLSLDPTLPLARSAWWWCFFSIGLMCKFIY